MKFLETISGVTTDTLISIERIHVIKFFYAKGWRIKIFTEDGDFEECFGDDEDKGRIRYEMIKLIIEAK